MDERNKDEEQGVKKKKYIIPEEIELEEGLQLRRVYDWLPYTYWRILRVMKEFGWDMIQIWQDTRQTAARAIVRFTASWSMKPEE